MPENPRNRLTFIYLKLTDPKTTYAVHVHRLCPYQTKNNNSNTNCSGARPMERDIKHTCTRSAIVVISFIDNNNVIKVQAVAVGSLIGLVNIKKGIQTGNTVICIRMSLLQCSHKLTTDFFNGTVNNPVV